MPTTCVPICWFMVYYALRVLYRFKCTYLCERCRKRRELSQSHLSGRVTWLSYVTRDKHWLSITSCHLPIKKACFTGFILLSLVWFVRLFSHVFFFIFIFFLKNLLRLFLMFLPRLSRFPVSSSRFLSSFSSLTQI